MLKRLSVSQSELDDDEDAVLAEAVLNAKTATEPLSEQERLIHDAGAYLDSVMMDGHFSTFSNYDAKRIGEMKAALEKLGAQKELALLANGLALWVQHGSPDPEKADDALTNALDGIDEEFYAAAAAPEGLESLTRGYVREHLNTFVAVD